MKIYFSFISILMTLMFQSCKDENTIMEDDKDKVKLFSALSEEESGVSFANTLLEDAKLNYFTYQYIYMGGGVAVGDVNNDGLQDLYFTGNMVGNKLYLNQGDLKFKDITEVALVDGENRWVTGVTMADVDADGWVDIYVSVSGKSTTTRNLLYKNTGLNDDGLPVFVECAEKVGIADDGHSTQGVFFDFDKDGDLDLYVANYPYAKFNSPYKFYRRQVEEKNHQHSDRFYKNKGDGTFEDATATVGIQNYGLSLGVSVGDFNQDGWEDIYVSNDFATTDHFYFNNGDGTFTDRIWETTQHTSFYGMGTDVADFNNDGLLDILQMDMTPKGNKRSKANMASMNPAGFKEIINTGMHHQYMQNAFQMNNGLSEDGLPHFSDVSRMMGVASTDWSWAGLFADLDNDGWKDIFITNGTRRDINNKDYFNYPNKTTKRLIQTQNLLQLALNMPSEKIDNYALKNNGDLSFSKTTNDWGLNFEGYSNGAAYADLDNDGDLEVIINNIDAPAIIYKNHSIEQYNSNYLRILLRGSDKNQMGLGTKISIDSKGEKQYLEQSLTRGYQSSVDPIIHFGLGKAKLIDSINVTWPDGKKQTLTQIAANQTLIIDYSNSSSQKKETVEVVKDKLFKEVTIKKGIDYQHQENEHDDYQYQVLLPHMYSKNGPGLTVGDVNGDKLDDFFIGGAMGKPGVLFFQKKNGTFKRAESDSFKKDRIHEDLGATFFDADGDGDLDLYVVSGGNEFGLHSNELQDRFYVNDGKGHFKKETNALPEMTSSGSRVKFADYDNDGDLDLFVCGRVIPNQYPKPAKSYILRNDYSKTKGIKFTDVTEEICPQLLEAGLVTDAVWVDFDNDTFLDLVIVGEWMPLTFLKNESGKFSDKTSEYNLDKTSGWWYSIIAEDFDNDGDMDFVAGNLGLNYKYQASMDESFDVYAKDYDRNGKLDIVLGYYDKGVQYPLRGRQCSSEQIPQISKKFKDYNSFAEASIEDVYTVNDLQSSLHYQAWTFASSYIENKGNGKFEIKALPNEVQVSSINCIVAEDFNLDGRLDLVVAGNMFTSEVETPRNDASYGKYLTGDGKGNFRAVPYSESGFYLKNDTKDMSLINTVNGKVILAANNDDALKAFEVGEQ